jgi:hypothetical protein
MESIYKEVAERLNVDKKLVEDIYRDYVTHLRKEMVARPEREMYLEKFGKFVPNVLKLKKKLRIAFKLRQKEKVKKIINTLKQLNYNKKN